MSIFLYSNLNLDFYYFFPWPAACLLDCVGDLLRGLRELKNCNTFNNYMTCACLQSGIWIFHTFMWALPPLVSYNAKHTLYSNLLRAKLNKVILVTDNFTAGRTASSCRVTYLQVMYSVNTLQKLLKSPEKIFRCAVYNRYNRKKIIRKVENRNVILILHLSNKWKIFNLEKK